MNIFMLFPEGKQKALTLSYDDGVFQDIRFMRIIDKYGLKCTFNINTGCFSETDAEKRGRLSEKQALELYSDSGHEVAVHAVSHPFLEELPTHIANQEIIGDRKKIEELFGTVCRGMAYPFGTYSDDVVELLRLNGIAYSRTAKATGGFKIPSDWLRLNPTCHHKDARLFEYCDSFLEDDRYCRPKLFYLWGHTYEFDDKDNWDIIEKFAEKMGGRDNIWYAVNIDIYDYVMAYNRLIFSADGHKVYNPSAIPVWFSCNKETVKVNPGETVMF